VRVGRLEPTSDYLDRTLLRAWKLFLEDPSDEVDNELEELRPILGAAGYLDDAGDRWGFSALGIARAEELKSTEPG
jgi:hypothetical protein